jgi:hypothetical protein
MSQHVVRNDLGIIYDKVGVSNRVELALWYEAQSVMDGHSVLSAKSRNPTPWRFLDLLRQFLHGFDRHALDIDHFATQPSSEPDR